MANQGTVITYLEMCQLEGASLQRGMNFRLHHDYSVILMSVRPGAPYADRVEDEGRVLIYEGHDVPKTDLTPNPKIIDQPMYHPRGGFTQNGLFFNAARTAKQGDTLPELVRVYEKIRSGLWVFNGVFRLLDAWVESSGIRNVFKFRLELSPSGNVVSATDDLELSRIIPSPVKQEAWRRDRGRCVKCGATDNLHFDHIIPYARGGSSLVASNIQILCARHNLAKSDRIE